MNLIYLNQYEREDSLLCPDKEEVSVQNLNQIFVIELLKGEKDLNTIATENNIQPNLLRNWKKEFLNNASVVFDDKREENLKEKLAEERKEKAAYAKKVGQLTMQVDWLKKKSEEICGPDYNRKLVPKPFDD